MKTTLHPRCSPAVTMTATSASNSTRTYRPLRWRPAHGKRSQIPLLTHNNGHILQSRVHRKLLAVGPFRHDLHSSSSFPGPADVGECAAVAKQYQYVRPTVQRLRRSEIKAVTGTGQRMSSANHGKELREVDVIVFDWDGTVVDSIGHITTSWSSAFSEFYDRSEQQQLPRRREDLPPFPTESWIKQCIGLSVDATISRYLPDACPVERSFITEAYRKHFRAGAGNTKYLPGAEDGLRQLIASGYTLAVATGKSRRGLDFELELLGARALFRSTRTADCTKSKPHPQMLLEIIDETESVASRTLMVGDSCMDMRMAEYADVAGIAMTCGAEPREALIAANPILVADNWAELMACLLNECTPYRR